MLQQSYKTLEGNSGLIEVLQSQTHLGWKRLKLIKFNCKFNKKKNQNFSKTIKSAVSLSYSSPLEFPKILE